MKNFQVDIINPKILKSLSILWRQQTIDRRWVRNDQLLIYVYSASCRLDRFIRSQLGTGSV